MSSKLLSFSEGDKQPLDCRWLRTLPTFLITLRFSDFPVELLLTNEMINFVWFGSIILCLKSIPGGLNDDLKELLFVNNEDWLGLVEWVSVSIDSPLTGADEHHGGQRLLRHPRWNSETGNKETLAAVHHSSVLLLCSWQQNVLFSSPPTPTQMQKQHITTGGPAASTKTRRTKAAEAMLNLYSHWVKLVGEACSHTFWCCVIAERRWARRRGAL